MQPTFVDYPLRIIELNFSSPLTDVVMELEHLRRLQLSGDTPPAVFFQLKTIFHTLESLGSARIEGNHTTLADYIESKVENLAEQTRRGFVYVVSNIGAFGEGVYKIGLTRRLDPQERVDELGGASVPFRFDIHAMCYSEDAPSLENALHKHFTNRRINAVNLRKEFFRVSLEEIEIAVKNILGAEVDFIKSVKASDYYESRRLLNR